MRYINEICADAEVYSFGKVSRIGGGTSIEVEFCGATQKILTASSFDVGEWIKFYGKMQGDALMPAFIVRMPECDIDLLKRGIEYTRRNNT